VQPIPFCHEFASSFIGLDPFFTLWFSSDLSNLLSKRCQCFKSLKRTMLWMIFGLNDEGSMMGRHNFSMLLLLTLRDLQWTIRTATANFLANGPSALTIHIYIYIMVHMQIMTQMHCFGAMCWKARLWGINN
jgi:hypothetical protein